MKKAWKVLKGALLAILFTASIAITCFGARMQSTNAAAAAQPASAAGEQKAAAVSNTALAGGEAMLTIEETTEVQTSKPGTTPAPITTTTTTQLSKPSATAAPTTTKPAESSAVAAAPQGAKTLEQLYGTLAGSTRGYEAIQAHIGGNTLTIEVYVNFKGAYGEALEGKTRAELAKQGFRLWAGAYAGSNCDFEPGMSFSVTVSIHDIYDGADARAGQNYFDFVCLASTGRGFTFYGVGYYNRELLGTCEGAIPDKRYTNGAIAMYTGTSSRYTANQYVKVAAHEFGHVLGLGDLYGKGVASTQECPQGKKYVGGDIMGSHGNVTPNNIEMMLAAYTSGWYQAYVNSDLPEVKSGVIRSY